MQAAPQTQTAIYDIQDLIQTWPLSYIIAEAIRTMPASPRTVVVGAYKGKVMHYLSILRSDITVIGYEPQVWAATLAEERLFTKPHCVVNKFGLGIGNYSATMNEFGTDAASLVSPEHRPDHQGNVEIHDAKLELGSLGKIDLLIMNIEGYEYALLPYVMPLLMQNVDALAVQLHLQPPYADPDHAKLLYDLDSIYPRHFNYYLPSWGYWTK